MAVTTTATPEPPRPLRRQTRRERRASTDSAWERRRASSSVCAIPASEFPLRPVALEVFYLGWAFRGFTTQTSVSSDLSSSSSAAAPSRQRGSEAYGDDGTVEAQLFRALRRTGLVPCLVQPGGEEGSEGNEKKNGRRGRGGGGNGGDGSGGGDFEEALPPSSSAEAPSTWKDLGYARCGRTDAGVSGMGQVVSLRLRSKLRRFQKVKKKSKEKERSGDDGDDDDDGDDYDGLFASSSPPSSSEEDDKQDESDSEEIDYPSLLNKALPAEVRVTGWAPLRDDGSFSARFSATAREYRYFFVDDSNLSGAGGGLDLAAMREAASALVGLRDFRNVCKPDLPAVTNFVRRVYSCEVEEWTGALDDPFPSGEATPSPRQAAASWARRPPRRASGGPSSASAAPRSSCTRSGASRLSCSWSGGGRRGPRSFRSCLTSRRRRGSRTTTSPRRSRCCSRGATSAIDWRGGGASARWTRRG